MKMKSIIAIATIIAIASMGTIQAQNIRGPLRDGNRSYKKDHFDEAERHYRRAAEIDSMDYRALFNLGNALYRQKKYDEELAIYQEIETKYYGPGAVDAQIERAKALAGK